MLTPSPDDAVQLLGVSRAKRWATNVSQSITINSAASILLSIRGCVTAHVHGVVEA